MFSLIYSIGSYALFLLVFVGFALFSDGIFMPASTGAVGGVSVGSAVAVDLGLILLFGVQHSVMARSGFKRVLTQALPAHLERATFVLVSSLVLAVLIAYFRPFGGVVWSVQNEQAVSALWIVNALGWVGVPLSSLMIDHFELFGVKQAFVHFRRTSFEPRGFVTPLLYKYVRHPMMTSILVGLWVTPQMTASHLLLSVGMTVYVLIGVHFEERALIRELGIDYERYRASTPKFLPSGPRAVLSHESSTRAPRESV